jgi:hypothetical protein
VEAEEREIERRNSEFVADLGGSEFFGTPIVSQGHCPHGPPQSSAVSPPFFMPSKQLAT